MRNAVMISIRPKWCEMIASGEKTIEVRKTRPKIDAPFKCYIYCTLVGTKEYFHSITEELGVCESQRKWNKEKWYDRKGNIIGEFVCDAIQEWKWEPAAYEEAEEGEFAYNILTVDGEKTGMEYDEFEEYGNKKTLYGWHISDLVIYDKPKELSEFKNRQLVWRGNNHIHTFETMKRPPQSWCYVEEIEDMIRGSL